MLARSLGLSKVEGIMRTPKNISYMNSWISKRLTNNVTKLAPNYGSNQDARGTDSEFSLQDPNYSMWRSITAENVELEQKPTDQTANIHNYYKERWLQEQKEGRLDVALKPQETSPSTSHDRSEASSASIYRQLAKKHPPIEKRGARLRPPSDFMMDEPECPPRQSFTGRKMTRARDSSHVPLDNYYTQPPAGYQAYEKPKVEKTEPIGMPKSGSFTVSSFKLLPDQPKDSVPALNARDSASTVVTPSATVKSMEEKGMSWEMSRESPTPSRKRSVPAKDTSGNDESTETPTCFEQTTAPAPNFKLTSGQ